MSAEINKYLENTSNNLFAFVVTLPLLIMYNSLYFMRFPLVNGVDFLSRFLFRYTGSTGFLVVNGALILGSVIAGFYLKKKGRLSAKLWLMVTAEGLLYGLAVGKVIVEIMVKVRLLSTTALPHVSPVMNVLTSAGAGYHEELFFRLIPLGVTRFTLNRWYKGKKAMYVLILSTVILFESAAFSWAHFMGAIETPSWNAFWFRFLFGLFMSMLFLWRGFAVTSYTHFLYDVIVGSF